MIKSLLSTALVISTLCALQCIEDQNDDASTVIDVAMQQNVEVAQTLGGVRAHTVTAAHAIDELVVLSMRSALVGGALIGLMSFEGDQMELVSAAPLVAEARKAGSACTFGGVRRRFGKGVVLGVSRLRVRGDAGERELSVNVVSGRMPLSARGEPPALTGDKSFRSLLGDAAKKLVSGAQELVTDAKHELTHQVTDQDLLRSASEVRVQTASALSDDGT